MTQQLGSVQCIINKVTRAIVLPPCPGPLPNYGSNSMIYTGALQAQRASVKEQDGWPLGSLSSYAVNVRKVSTGQCKVEYRRQSH